MNIVHSEKEDRLLVSGGKNEYDSFMKNRRRKMDPEGKRAAIMAAGERLFAAQGYTGTTMADIARDAGVAVGSLYRLFPDKPALLAELHRAMEQRFIEAMSRGWQSVDAYEDRFDPMIEALMKEAEAAREIMPLYAMTRELVESADFVPGHAMIEAIKAQYQEGRANGAYLDQDPAIVAPIAHGMVEGAMRAWMTKPTAHRRKAVAADLKELFRRAFVVAR